MAKTLFGNSVSVAAVFAAAICGSACAANPPADGAAPMAGSPQVILAAKLPGPMGPHLAAADQAEAAVPETAMPGSAAAILAAKAPGVYGPHLPAAESTQTQVAGNSCWPGSAAAIMSVKFPPNARPGNAGIYKDCH